jgi:hypothetical protein
MCEMLLRWCDGSEVVLLELTEQVSGAASAPPSAPPCQVLPKSMHELNNRQQAEPYNRTKLRSRGIGNSPRSIRNVTLTYLYHHRKGASVYKKRRSPKDKAIGPPHPAIPLPQPSPAVGEVPLPSPLPTLRGTVGEVPLPPPLPTLIYLMRPPSLCFNNVVILMMVMV